MQEIIYSNKNNFEKTINNIKSDWFVNLHLLADFDRTLTKAFSFWKKRPSLISVLRSDWYLSENYSKEANKLYNYYSKFENDTNISLDEKKKHMKEWRTKHFNLLIESWLHKRDIEKIIESRIIELREWIKELLKFLAKNNIPIIIISANWLWTDSIKIYLEKEWFLTPNVKIISNEFVWDTKWNAIDYDKRVIHVFNKDETVLKEFPEIYNQIESRKNVILLGDSLWDVGMIEWFDYNNLLKIGFLNDNEDILLEEYKNNYDVVLTWDNEANLLSNILK